MSWINVLKTVAPTLATALGGPLAGAAVAAVSGAILGHPSGTEEEVSQAVLGAAPDTLLKLKEADYAFKTKMAELGVNLEKISAEDRNSARNREIQTKDPTVKVLAYAYTVGYFITLGFVMKTSVHEDMLNIVMVLIGVLTAAQAQIMNFYFGSSAGSALKNEMLAKK